MCDMNNTNVLPIRDAAASIGVSHHTIRQWKRDGMPFTRAAVTNPRETGAVLVDLNVAREWASMDGRATGSGGLQRRAAEARMSELLPRLLDVMGRGVPLNAACVAVGIHPNTAKGWIRRGAPAAADLLDARASEVDRAAAKMRAGMERFLEHYRAGMDIRAAAVAAGYSKYQAYNWKSAARFPDLAAWFTAEIDRVTATRPPSESKAGRPPKLGRVYFIQGVTGGCIKIGFTMYDPARRMADLQTGSPVKLQIIHVVVAPRTSEKWAHVRFAGSHSHGEWFRPTADLLTFIESGGALPDREPQQLALMRA